MSDGKRAVAIMVAVIINLRIYLYLLRFVGLLSDGINSTCKIGYDEK
jgi:hypothetical protein